MFNKLTIIFKNGARQVINLHSSFNTSEKVNGRTVTPSVKGYTLASDIAGDQYLHHQLT